MKFRDDIDPANTWVVSDSHFGHDNIVGFCHRPEDHEQVMIAEWRKEVPDDATVIHLGDLAYRGNARFKNLLAPELTGAKKHIIFGNHDRQRFSFYKQCGFSPARPFAIAVNRSMENVDPNGPSEYGDSNGWCNRISFSHYPWSDADEGRRMTNEDVRLHGHIHNNGYTREAYVPFLKNHINLSVEQTKYKPVNLKLLLDAYLFGEFPETTQEQLDEARERKEQHSQ